MFPLTNKEPYIMSTGERTTLGEMLSKNDADINQLKEALSDEVETRAALGAHNLVNVTANTQTAHGVLITVNSDKSITLANAATATGSVNLTEYFTLTAGDYILSKQTITGSVVLYLASAGGEIASVPINKADVSFTLEEATSVQMRFYIENGKTYNATVYPMIRLSTDSDTTYQPYAKTNVELTDKLATSVLVSGNYTSVAAETWEYANISFVLDKTSLVNLSVSWNNSAVRGVAIGSDSTSANNRKLICESTTAGSLQTTGVLGAGTWYVWVKYREADCQNNIKVNKLMELDGVTLA